MVSKFGHCLNNILYQWKTNNLNINIPCIISNHKEYARNSRALWHNL